MIYNLSPAGFGTAQGMLIWACPKRFHSTTNDDDDDDSLAMMRPVFSVVLKQMETAIDSRFAYSLLASEEEPPLL